MRQIFVWLSENSKSGVSDRQKKKKEEEEVEHERKEMGIIRPFTPPKTIRSAKHLRFDVYSRIPIFRTSKGNGNWFEKSGVRKIEGGIKSHLFYRGIVL